MTTTKQYQLPREFAEKWVKALRSGEYKQGQIKLQKGDEYCCLGVAGILCGLGDHDLLDHSLFYNQTNAIHLLPSEIVGLASRNTLVGSLTTMNDSGKSFPEIADWIEQNVEFV